MEEKYMRTDKIVLRAIVSTLIAMTVLFGVMLLALCFIFPSAMMHITYDMGMEKWSVRNARRAYKTSGEAYYIAFATEVAIGADMYAEVEGCGETLMSNGKFVAYCETKDKQLKQELSYRDYVQSQVCLAKYKQGKKQQAVDKAFACIGESFPENNAVVAVLLTALNANDSATVNIVKTKLTQLQTSVPEADKPYLQTMLGLTDSIITEK